MYELFFICKKNFFGGPGRDAEHIRQVKAESLEIIRDGQRPSKHG